MAQRRQRSRSPPPSRPRKPEHSSAATSRRIIHAAGSASTLNIAPARSEEVAQFVADTRLQKEFLGLEGPHDPLMYLPHVLQSLAPDPSERHNSAANGLS